MAERVSETCGPASFADVCVGYPVEGVFTYAVPDGIPVPAFSRVKVDFRGRTVTAFVLALHRDTPAGFEVKEIRSVIDESPIFDERLLDCARYVAETISDRSVKRWRWRFLRANGRRSATAILRPSASRAITLTGEQQSVYDAITTSFDSGAPFHLLHGITGSGKTEVYMEVARRFMGGGHRSSTWFRDIALVADIRAAP